MESEPPKAPSSAPQASMAISMKELTSVKLKRSGERQGLERTVSLDPAYKILSGAAAKSGQRISETDGILTIHNELLFF